MVTAYLYALIMWDPTFVFPPMVSAVRTSSSKDLAETIGKTPVFLLQASGSTYDQALNALFRALKCSSNLEWVYPFLAKDAKQRPEVREKMLSLGLNPG